MHLRATRRGFIGTSSLLVFSGFSGMGITVGMNTQDPPEPTSAPEYERPSPLQRESVQAIVGAAHRDLDRVRSLLDGEPALVNAAWDWGGGDWETALGAAGHTARVEIAELLLERGARIELHAAAMLGWLEVIKSAVAARPGVENVLGPHAIPMHSHARFGGERAANVLAYLESIDCLRDLPVEDDRRAAITGRYRIEGGDDVLTVYDANRRLLLEPPGRRAWYMLHQGDQLFRPADGPKVKVTFEMNGDATAAKAMHIDEGNDQAVAIRIT